MHRCVRVAGRSHAAGCSKHLHLLHAQLKEKYARLRTGEEKPES